MDDKKAEFDRWMIVGVQFGEPINHLDREHYSYHDLKDIFGVNCQHEFGEFHRCIVVSKARYNYGKTINVIPITTYREGDEDLHYKIVMERDKQTKKFIKHKSTILFSHMRSIAKTRIVHNYNVHLPENYQRKIEYSLNDMFGLGLDK